MQDYHIYAHYTEKQGVSKTSPKYETINKKTQSVPKEHKEKSNSLNLGNVRKGIATSLAVASKINSYVGEYTENTLTASRRQVGITYAGMALFAFTNPALALGSMAMYTGNKVMNYAIKVDKENLSADFMRQLSGGTVSTRR